MDELTKTFYIDALSDMDDRRYSGSFTTKKLTMGDLSRMGMRKAQLSGGHNYNPETGQGVDVATNMINEMIAHCETAVVQCPDWFDPQNMVDVEILQKVYEEVASFEANFHSRKRTSRGEEPDRSGADTGSVERQGQGGTDGSSQDVVDKKIPKISELG